MLPIVAESILLEKLAQNYGLPEVARVTTASSETQNHPSPKNLKTGSRDASQSMMKI
jgi:hypothetical protein